MIDRTKVIVVDLDGTLYDHSHRQEHMQNREWDKYHSMLSEDTVFQDVRLFVGAFTDRYPFVVISVTGRPEQYREESMIKLHKDRILLDEVLMRPDNDFSSDGSHEGPAAE